MSALVMYCNLGERITCIAVFMVRYLHVVDILLQNIVYVLLICAVKLITPWELQDEYCDSGMPN
jgi:hypothetical protein